MSTPNAGLEVDITRTRYQTPKDGLKAAGLKLTTDNKKAQFVWIDGFITRDEAVEYDSEQRINKIPGMDYICYKSTLFQQLNTMRKAFPDIYNTVYPKAFLFPTDFAEFQREHSMIIGKTQQAPTWVIKPKNGCCGHGIVLVQSTYEASEVTEPSVCQIYVAPFLINKRKFDFRLYVLIASIDPLTFFIYKEGIARFCTDPYEPPSRNNKDHKFCHLTNTAINVENGNVDPSEFTKKFTETLDLIIKQNPTKGKMLWEKICDVTRAVIIGVLPAILGSLPKKNDRLNSKYKNLTSESTNGFTANKNSQYQRAVQPPNYPPPRSDIIRKQMNFVLQKDDSTNSTQKNGNNDSMDFGIGVGSSSIITNYQLPSVKPPQQRVGRRGSISPDHRMRRKVIIPKPAHTNNKQQPHKTTIDNSTVVTTKTSTNTNNTSNNNTSNNNTSNNNTSKNNPSNNNPINDSIDNNINKEMRTSVSDPNFTHENELENENEINNNSVNNSLNSSVNNCVNEGNNEDESLKIKKPVRTKISKRFFHILGIDILVSDECEPFALELNDRPSLSVTVPFESDLKVKLIRDSFFHILPGGEVGPEVPESDWQLIFPVPAESPKNAQWQSVMAKATIPAPPSNMVASSSATNRMASSGINAALHQERRQRFLEIKENSKGTKFHPY
ncbi:hypothetical protein TRFO_25650 [Tritrichomonas foetus]|uniref:Tubulin-tyrosine ligase family protein n=1 Tax=Tritrichomonas foetus TaxID=1144522 RepID=A0A1J4KA33_9EUKA|nr:hypothetical protein TRFO_25650 [Tritrichomonas foetus]|eukprot:OHT06309.1 hypothetical protein TRFO_25650 [Tritrichomonas foetus]